MNNGQTALINAAFGGHEAVAKVLLDHGADIALDSALSLIFSALYR